MNKTSGKKLLFLVLLLGSLSLLQSAYVLQTFVDANPTALAWNTDDFPIQMQIWEGFSDQLPNIANGSGPKVALREALERWARVSSLAITLGLDSAVTDAGKDGINLVTIADTQANRDVVGQAAGLSAVQFTFFTDPNTGQVVEVRIDETDVIFNPTVNWTTLETDDEANNTFDVALHEFGHSWNLHHPISRTSTMFFQGGGFDFGFNALSWDDIAGINVTYPIVGLDQITGTVAGQVTREGNPVFGAFVVAVDEKGLAVSNTITLPDGTYQLQFLPPGNYSVYVEPLDNPTTPANINGGIFDMPMVSDFLPKFFNDSMTPSVTVTAGATTGNIDFEVSQANATVDPLFVGISSSSTSARVSSTPAESFQDRDSDFFVVAGAGVSDLRDDAGVFFLGDTVTAGPVANTGTSTDGTTTFKWFPLTVPLNAPKGEYPVFLQSQSELGVITGGLAIFSPFRFLQAFAQFADIQGITSGLFLINTNLSGNATGKISARIGADRAAAIGVDPGSRTAISLGSLTADANGDLDFGLGLGGALSVKTEVDGQFVGSLRAEADRRLGGTVLFESQFGTTGVGPSRPLYTFIAPIEFKGGGASVNTGLAITNLDERPANVFIQVQNQNGDVLGSTILNLEGNGHIARFIHELFTGLPDFDGSAVVTANRKVGATVIATEPAANIFTTFPAIQNRIFTRSFFAQFAHVGGLSSRLVLVNPSPVRTANVSIQVRDKDGNAASVTLSGEVLSQGNKTVSIPPLGSVVLQTQSEIEGSVEVSSQDVPVGGVVLFSGPGVGTAGVGESFPQTDFVLPIERNISAGTKTGIAILNTKDQPVQVTLTVRDQNGTTEVVNQITLQPRERLAKFANEDPLNLKLAETFTGSLWITASDEIGATVIRVSPGVLTTFPIIPLAQFITPAD